MNSKRSDRPPGEPGRYISDDKYYAYYLLSFKQLKPNYLASREAGINRKTGATIWNDLVKYNQKAQVHPRILEIEAKVSRQEAQMSTKTNAIIELDPHARGRDVAVLEAKLSQRVIGQSEAIRAVVDAYDMTLAGLVESGRSLGNFLFLGPTGSGKTYLVESLAGALLGDPRAVIKIDCGEFQHDHEIAKLIGSPPGYLGHRETHPRLSQETINASQTEKMKISFLLFDEIEKASNAMWKILLGIMDKACLTLGDNKRVDFTRVMLFLTSNLGAKELEGRQNPKFFSQPAAGAIEKPLTDVARRYFTPEFFNRLDHIVTFKPLDEVAIRQILDLEISAFEQRLGEKALRLLHVTDAAKDELFKRGYDPRYGGREIKRVIQRELARPLAHIINSGQLGIQHTKILVDYRDGEFRFSTRPFTGILVA